MTLGRRLLNCARIASVSRVSVDGRDLAGSLRGPLSIRVRSLGADQRHTLSGNFQRAPLASLQAKACTLNRTGYRPLSTFLEVSARNRPFSALRFGNGRLRAGRGGE